MHSVKPQKNEAEMTVGKHTVRVPCKSKKDGKQLASQAILKVNLMMFIIFSIIY